MSFLIVSAIAAVIGICSYAVTQTPDGPIEEASEVVIEKQINLPEGSVDLTPSSPEKSSSDASTKKEIEKPVVKV